MEEQEKLKQKEISSQTQLNGEATTQPQNSLFGIIATDDVKCQTDSPLQEQKVKKSESNELRQPGGGLIGIFAGGPLQDQQDDNGTIMPNKPPKRQGNGNEPRVSKEKIAMMEQKKQQRNEKKKNKQRERLLRKQAELRNQRELSGQDQDNQEEKKPSQFQKVPRRSSQQQKSSEFFLQSYKKKDAQDGKMKARKLPKEKYYGNIEYKRKLSNPTPERLANLTTQMQFRLSEGNGEALYYIGVEDNGKPLGISETEMQNSLLTIHLMAINLKAEIYVLKVRKGEVGQIAEILVRKNQMQGFTLQLRILLLGDFDVGKSTLIGVLISGKEDNGKGSARTNVFRHKHELLEGRTSSLSHQILGFDSQGNVTNRDLFGNISWAQIVDKSSKILTFIDVAGHTKYQKSLMQGVSHLPDYAIITVSAAQGITEVTDQHFKLLQALNIPLIVVISKIDLAQEEELLTIMLDVKRKLKKELKKIPLVVKSQEDVVLCSRNLGESITPIFALACTYIKSIELFQNFLNLLPTNSNWSDLINQPVEFHISETFHKKDECIFAGAMLKGTVRTHQRLLLGPDQDGGFKVVEVKSIFCKKVSVRSVQAGQICTFCINLGKFGEAWLKKMGGHVRKGMVLVDLKAQPKATRTFEAMLITIDGSNKIIKSQHQPVIHTQQFRQVAKILPTPGEQGPTQQEEEEGSSSQKHWEIEVQANKATRVTFRFMYYPQYLVTGSYLMISDQRLKLFGQISKVYHDAVPQISKKSSQGQQQAAVAVQSESKEEKKEEE